MSTEPTRPAFEPVTMPSAFDALIDLYPDQGDMDDYDRTTQRLLVGGACLAVALLGVLVLMVA